MHEKLKHVRHLALDLDGTIYLGKSIFDFTKPFLAQLKELGIGYSFLTNNSSRSTKQYVEHLNKLGIDATAEDLFSSTHATLDYLRREQPGVRRIFVLGTPALQEEFAENGFAIGSVDPRDEPDAVVVGFDTTLVYARVCQAAWWLSKGKPFICIHPDRTRPSDLPTVLVDCGAICAMLTAATGCEPDAILGKPNPRMIAALLRRHNLRPEQLGVVGDRLYTDIAMARAAGAVGILVLTGETTREQATQATPPPDLIVENVGELLELLER